MEKKKFVILVGVCLAAALLAVSVPLAIANRAPHSDEPNTTDSTTTAVTTATTFSTPSASLATTDAATTTATTTATNGAVTTTTTTLVTATTTTAAVTQPTFSVDSVTVGRGETVTVCVRAMNNPGIISCHLYVQYDAAVLELETATGQDFAGVTFGPTTKNPFSINWIDALHPDNTTDGVICRLTFRVKEGAPLGDTKLRLSYPSEDVFNMLYEDVVFQTRDGILTVQ